MSPLFPRFAAWPATAPLKAATVLLLALVFIAVAIAFPTTPDEVSRITEAKSWMSDAPNSYYWPIGNVALVLITPFKSGGQEAAVVAVRLMNAGLTLALLTLLIRRTGSALALGVLAVVAPYLALVGGTAAQQGLMTGLIALLVVAMADDRRALFAVASALLYLVNPATIVILPLGLFLMSGNRAMRPFLLAALIGYGLTWPFIAFAWWDGGQFLPTISANGAQNLVLGNNPHPLAARGIADDALLDRLFAPDAPSATELVGEYWRADPAGFLTNILRKAWLYWMPWDYFRSDIGSTFYTLLFAYVGIAQAAIYGAALLLRRHIPTREKRLALGLALAAWLVYTIFFVKFRFRIPFDFALLAALMLGYRPGVSRTRA